MNVQVLADPAGRLPWASPALPGAFHGPRAARTHGIIDALVTADLLCWTDEGYQSAGDGVRVSYRGRWEKLSQGHQAVNVSHAKFRASGGRAIATLRTWRCCASCRRPRGGARLPGTARADGYEADRILDGLAFLAATIAPGAVSQFLK